jgi:hypothetical protein
MFNVSYSKFYLLCAEPAEVSKSHFLTFVASVQEPNDVRFLGHLYNVADQCISCIFGIVMLSSTGQCGISEIYNLVADYERFEVCSRFRTVFGEIYEDTGTCLSSRQL